jgi:hypothetical protein
MLRLKLYQYTLIEMNPVMTMSHIWWGSKREKYVDACAVSLLGRPGDQTHQSDRGPQSQNQQVKKKQRETGSGGKRKKKENKK